MNNNNIELLAKVDHLSKVIQEKKNKAIGTTKMYAIVYGIIVLFVFGYTSVIFAKLKEYSTPDNISALVKNKIKDSLPGLNQVLVTQARKNAPIIAEKAVEAINESIPKIEDLVKNVIDENAKHIILQIKGDMFPKFHQILKDNAKEINDSATALTDENVAKEIAKNLVAEIEREIDYNIIGDEFYKKLDSFRTELEAIATKPANELTMKEAAERKIIVNWIYLIKNGESLQSITSTIMARCSFVWEDLIGKITRTADDGSIELKLEATAEDKGVETEN